MKVLKSEHSNRWRLLRYGLILGLLVVVLKWLQYRFLIRDPAEEFYIAAVALIFLFLGGWLASQWEEADRENEVEIKSPSINGPAPDAQQDIANLSSRELEVLQLMAKGYRNIDIAQQLYISLSTVKTHVSNIYKKMDVKRRTQALRKARELAMID